MNIYEKIGDFILTMVNLIVGGIIFAAIMSSIEYSPLFYALAAFLAICFFILAIFLFRISKNRTFH